jgi:hypothetical protein
MAVTHLGSKTVGAINIGVTLALPALAAALADLLARLAALTAQFTANVALLASLPDPTELAAAIAAAAAAAVGTITDIITNIPGPIASAQVSLGAELGLLNGIRIALEDVVNTLKAAVSAGGVHAFSVDTTNTAVAGELAAALTGGLPGGGVPTARVRGVLLLTEDPAAFAALSTVLLTG